MAYPFRSLILACALLLGAADAFAQNSGKIAIRFTVFSARDVEGLGYVSTSGAKLPVTFNPSSRSARHTYSGTAPVKFVELSTGSVVAEASVPPEIREPLFLFIELPAPTSRGYRYQIAVIDDSVTALAAGHLAILNLSGLKFTGLLEKTELVVGDGMNSPIPLPKAAKLTLYSNARGTRVQSFTGNLQPAKNSRVLLILFPPARKGALEVQTRSLADNPLAPPPNPKSAPPSAK